MDPANEEHWRTGRLLVKYAGGYLYSYIEANSTFPKYIGALRWWFSNDHEVASTIISIFMELAKIEIVRGDMGLILHNTLWHLAKFGRGELAKEIQRIVLAEGIVTSKTNDGSPKL
ncbi:MAG: hypothetical protein HZB55_24350 [Deltaproteobacteria bacterium]|nr:hypothetical protein [Deltaproteobacteria bacterium]